MLTLTIRTDKPQAEIGLYDQSSQLAYQRWPAHRQLAETIHQRINELLSKQKLTVQDLQAVVVYRGPGSFTGLRIGISVANALAAGLKLPISGTMGENWIEAGLDKLQSGQSDGQVVPEYGAEARTTTQKK